MKLEDGMVLAIEPMINIGSDGVFQKDDGWTIETKDGLHLHILNIQWQ